MSSIDQEFVEFVVKSLVGNPDAVVVDRRIDEKGVLLELTVDPEDLGRVIGKRGATAQSLRTLLRALGTKNEARYNLKIVDNGVPHERPAADDTQSVTNDSHSEPSLPDTRSTDADTDSQDDYVAASPAPSSNRSSDRVSQTRRELADLDDLDL